MMDLRVSFPMFTILFCLICIISGIKGLNNGLGRTPPMGWNSWNRVNIYCGVNV
jgi:hypothetical protein